MQANKFLRISPIFSLLFLLALAFVSCRKEPIPIGNTGNSCLLQPTIQANWNNCNNFPQDFFCSSTHIGDYTLSEKSKSYFPQYCLNEGETLVFHNAAGDTMQFVISWKYFIKSHVYYNTFQHCIDDPARSLAVCLTGEFAAFRLSNTAQDLVFRLELGNGFNPYMDANDAGDFFEISRQKDSNSYTVDFTAVTDPKGLDVSLSAGQQNLPSVTLNGQTYTDVTTIIPDSNLVPQPFRFYINPELGLIGFIDQQNVLWTLQA